MADDINFTTAAFSTVAMKPVGDEEINALWGRKIADNTIRAVGDWGTVVFGTTTSDLYGSTEINFSALGFTQIPSFEIFCMRGGTRLNGGMGYQLGSSGNNISMGIQWEVVGGSAFQVRHWPDGYLGIQRDFAGNEDNFGTHIYRLRGL